MTDQPVAFVSGSSQGIGLAIAEELVKSGYQVVVNSRNEAGGNTPKGSIHIKGDVSVESESSQIVSRITSEFGRLDLLICNVGSGSPAEPGMNNSEAWNRSINSNLKSATTLTDTAIDALMASKGNVIFISSICGSDPTISAPIEYKSAKAALDMYMKAMAYKYAPIGVRFNSISPGNVLFDGSVWHEKMSNNPEETQRYIKKIVPMNTLIQPLDIAKAVLFLSSESARYITGVNIPVDGGQSI